MPEFASVIEVWFDAPDQASANEVVKLLAAAVLDYESVRAVEASGAEELC